MATTIVRSSGASTSKFQLPKSPPFKILVFLVSLGLAFASTWWAFGLTLSIILNVSLVAHELGHLIVFKVFGLSTGMIVIPFLGAVTYTNDDDAAAKINQFRHALLSLVGPGVNIAIMIVAIFFIDGPYRDIATTTASLNAMLAAINLLPFLGMDGSQSAKAIFASADEINDAKINFWGTIVALGVAAFMILMGKFPLVPIMMLFGLSRASRADNPGDWQLPNSMGQTQAMHVAVVHLVMFGVAMAGVTMLPSWF